MTGYKVLDLYVEYMVVFMGRVFGILLGSKCNVLQIRNTKKVRQ